MPPLCARAAADPALLGGSLARGAHGAGIYAVAVADYVGRAADTIGWVIRGRGSETVCASEVAGIPKYAVARGNAVNWVIAVRHRIFKNLN